MYEEEVNDDVGTNELSEQSQANDTTGDDVAPVKFSKTAVAFILSAIIIVILIILFLINSLQFNKKPTKPKSTTRVEKTVDTETESNSVEDDSEFIENETETEDSSISSSEESLSENNSTEISTEVEETEESTEYKQPVNQPTSQGYQTNTTEQPIQQGIQPAAPQYSDGLTEVLNEPNLGAETETSGMVTGMSMYQKDNSYIYCVSILLVIGNDSKLECSYFCPRKTYNAVSIGDSLNVLYQQDSIGNVSVVSISK